MVFILGAIILLINLLYHVDEGKKVTTEEVKSSGWIMIVIAGVLGLGYLVLALDEAYA